MRGARSATQSRKVLKQFEQLQLCLSLSQSKLLCLKAILLPPLMR